MKGTLITITGISSTGKTTTANYLHQIINQELVGNKKQFKKPFLLLHLDNFVESLPKKYRLNEFEKKTKKINSISPELIGLLEGITESIKTFLDLGFNVIFEGAYGHSVNQYIQSSIPRIVPNKTETPLNVLYYKRYDIRLIRSLKGLMENEKNRKNVEGMAEAQFQDPDYQKLSNQEFDLNIKVDGLTPAEIVATIFKDFTSKSKS
jgi:energy-coupling factor transporter ATP-binding protein EcfA2